MSPKKKILITGASGFVGSFLVEEALHRGYEVHAGIRSSSNLKYLKDDRINHFSLDLAEPDLIRKRLHNIHFDFIIQCAGVTKAKSENTYFRVNADALEVFLEVLKEKDRIPEKFVFISSLAAYGPADKQPNNQVTINSIPSPVTTYGKSKLAGEKILQSYQEIPYNIIRPTAVYGPREMDLLTVYKMLNSGLEMLIGRQPQELTFVYVKDLVTATMDVLKSDLVQTSYFVTDGNTYSTEFFNGMVKKILGKKTLKMRLPISLVKILAIISEKISSLSGNYPALNLEKVNELKCLSWDCDISNLISDINYHPKYSLEAGLIETMDWYKKRKLL